MKKKSFLFALAFLVIVLSACVFCACNKKGEVTVSETESAIAMFDYPKQYYVVGEEMDFSSAKLFVQTINADGVKDKEGYKIIDFSDDDVKVQYPGMAIAGEVKTAVVSYHGFKTSFKYYVSDENGAIENVKFEVDNNQIPPTLLYAVSDIRINPDFNDLFIRIKYRDSSKVDYVRYINELPSYESAGLQLDGFDVKTVGTKTATLSYLATDYRLNYSVVEGDWIDYVELSQNEKSKIQLNYFVGDTINLGGAKFNVEYNSGKFEQRTITASDVKGFDTSAVSKGNRLFFAITDALGGAETFSYNVFDENETADMVKIVKYKGLGETIGEDSLKYLDSLSYEEFLKANLFRIFTEEGNEGSFIEIDGTNENFVITKSDGTLFDKAAYEAELADTTKGSRSVTLMFTYGNDARLVAEVTLNIEIGWANTRITGWDNNFIVAQNGEFDFGDAKLIKVLENGVEISISIQEEYKKAVYDRSINIWDSRSLQVTQIDTSTVGKFTDNYCIGVVGNVTVNGSSFDHYDSGRLYIAYTVTNA